MDVLKFKMSNLRKNLIVTIIIIFLVIIGLLIFFIIKSITSPKIIQYDHINNKSSDYLFEESNENLNICKNSFSGDFSSCKTLLNNTADCVWKSVFFEALIKNDIKICDKINFDSISQANFKNSLSKEKAQEILINLCKAILEKNIKYCDEIKNEYNNNKCLDVVSNTLDFFNSKNEKFCNIFNSPNFSKYCLAILNNNPQGCS